MDIELRDDVDSEVDVSVAVDCGGVSDIGVGVADVVAGEVDDDNAAEPVSSCFMR